MKQLRQLFKCIEDEIFDKFVNLLISSKFTRKIFTYDQLINKKRCLENFLS